MTLAARQLDMLRRMAALDPEPHFIGPDAFLADLPDEELEPRVERVA